MNTQQYTPQQIQSEINRLESVCQQKSTELAILQSKIQPINQQLMNEFGTTDTTVLNNKQTQLESEISQLTAELNKF